jgi:hypothetical protein
MVPFAIFVVTGEETMGIRPTLVCSLSLSFAWIVSWATLPCNAGEKEQVELLERACTQFESMSSAAGELTTLLESAQDPQSADAILDKLGPACEELVDAVQSTSSLLKQGLATPGGNIQTPDLKARADAAAQRQPGLVAEWKRQAERCGKELARIPQIPGLSARFQGEFQKQAVKLRSAMTLASIGTGGVSGIPTGPAVTPTIPPAARPPGISSPVPGSPPPGLLVQHMTYDQMAAQFGKHRVVRIEITNMKELDDNSDDISSAIFFAATRRDAQLLSRPGEQITAGYDFLNGKVWLGPIDDFDAFCKRIDYGQVEEQNAEERVAKVRVDAAKAKAKHEESERPWRESQAQARKAFEEQLRAAGVPEGTIKIPTVEDLEAKLPEASDPDYHKKLAGLMLNDANYQAKSQAIDALLAVQSEDIKDKTVRKQIAVNFRTLAERDGLPDDRGKAIRGLILYGGKFSIPILIEILKSEEMEAPPELFKAFVQYPDEKGAAAVANQLTNFFNRKEALRTLKQMGPAAEDALIAVAPSDDPEVSLAAVTTLGDVGTKKSLSLLNKAAKSPNQEVSSAAKGASKAIIERSRHPVAK